MAKNYVEEGDEIGITASAAYNSGDVNVSDGVLPGVMLTDAANGGQGTLKINGVFELTKLGTDAFAVGDDVYWDATNGCCTVTATSNTLIGKAFAAAGAGATTVKVLLNGLPD